MGRRGEQKRGRTQRRHFRQGRENVWKKPRADPSSLQNHESGWEPFVTENLAFSEYYQEQGIVPKGEWDEFLKILQKPLPAVFRINSSGPFANDIQYQLENEIFESFNAEEVGGTLDEFIKHLPWYPNKLVWQLNFSRMQLRKNQTLERIHEFLKQENELGNITRQEAVSMVPPLFLDVQPHQYILDMCAAPGSKTFQLLEMIHNSTRLGLLPDGMVIANDVDVQRCNLLIHQTKRMCSANLIVTNHEAQNFPRCHRNKHALVTNAADGREEECSGMIDLNDDIHVPCKTEILFDRVLCDVPCSGDGTIRKAPDIWRKWNAGMGNGVHRLQVQIAMRGVSLLKVGGRLVYSTCSMNPVEDEAVVGEILRQSRGSVELVDVSAELPQLKRRPGLKSWKVRDKGHWLTSYKQVPRNRKTSIVPSMFPSGKIWEVESGTSDGILDDSRKEENEMDVEKIVTKDLDKDDEKEKAVHEEAYLRVTETDSYIVPASINGKVEKESLGTPLEERDTNDEAARGMKEVASLPLERCMRIMPHDQDTGAFFIAVFQKVSPFTAEQKKSKERYKRQDVSVGRDFKQTMEDEADIGINDDQTQLAESDSTPSCVLMQNDLTSKEDTFNADEKIPAEVQNDECDSELGQTVNSTETKEEEDTKEKKLNIAKRREKGKIQQQGKWRGVDPVLLFTDEKTINSIVTFYGIKEAFPLQGHLVTRNSDIAHVKRIYYVSKSVSDAIKLNLAAGQQLKITSVGLKMFERQTAKEGSSPCVYRISSEGLPLLLPYLTNQIVYASKVDFKLLLSSRTVYFTSFHDSSFGTEASNLLPGCCVVILQNEEEDAKEYCFKPKLASAENPAIAIGCWKGRTNLSLMVSTSESEELLKRISFKYGKEMSDLAISKDNDTQRGADEMEKDIELKGTCNEQETEAANVSLK